MTSAGSSDTSSVDAAQARLWALARRERLADDRGEVDRLAGVDPALPMGQGEERVDQLLLLLGLVEHLLAGRPERARPSP